MDVWVKTRELLNSLAHVTESGSKIARYKIEVADLDRKLGLAFRKVGERACRLWDEDLGTLASDPEASAAFNDVKRLRHRMEAIHREVQKHSTKAGTEFGRATKIVKDEANRTADALKREAERAATIIKDETGRAASVIKKAMTGRGPARRSASKKPSEPEEL